MNNNSSIRNSDENLLVKPSFADVLSVYIVVGLISICFNLIIMFTMLHRNELRTKYYLVISLAIADFSVGIACLAGGSIRIIMTYLGYDNIIVRPLVCMLFPFEWYCHIGQLLAGLITIVISVDRYTSVSHPILYFQGYFTPKIRFGVGLTFAIFAIFIGFAYVSAYFEGDREVSIMCVATDSVGTLFTNVSAVVGFSSFFIAAALCIRTLIMLKQRSATLIEQFGDTNNNSRRDAKVTRTMTVIITAGLFLSFLPAFTVFINSSLNGGSKTFNRVNASICLLYGVNSASNFVIYIATNAEMRTLFLSAISWKRLENG